MEHWVIWQEEQRFPAHSPYYLDPAVSVSALSRGLTSMDVGRQKNILDPSQFGDASSPEGKTWMPSGYTIVYCSGAGFPGAIFFFGKCEVLVANKVGSNACFHPTPSSVNWG